MKKIIMIVLLLLLIPINSYGEYNSDNYENSNSNEISQDEIMSSQMYSLNIKEFLNESKKYTKDNFDDIDFEELFNSIVKGDIDNKKIFEQIFKIAGKETVSSITTIASIMIIIIIHGVLKSISEGLENKDISKICYYVQYILIVTLIMSNFTQIISSIKDAIENLVAFSYTLIPILITLVLTTGNIVSANLIEPILILIMIFIGILILNVMIPILLASTILGIISKISDYVQLDKLSKLLKSGMVWFLAVVLTLFVSLVSVEGNLSSSVDGVTAKTAKAAVSSLIPVVGKILGDAVDTVIGCTSILKNAVGIIGVIVIIGICISPIIKLLFLMITYYIGSAICQPLADEKIVKLLEQMGDTFKVLLAILCSLSVMLIIGTTLVMKISNSGLMYR